MYSGKVGSVSVLHPICQKTKLTALNAHICRCICGSQQLPTNLTTPIQMWHKELDTYEITRTLGLYNGFSAICQTYMSWRWDYNWLLWHGGLGIISVDVFKRIDAFISEGMKEEVHHHIAQENQGVAGKVHRKPSVSCIICWGHLETRPTSYKTNE